MRDAVQLLNSELSRPADEPDPHSFFQARDKNRNFPVLRHSVKFGQLATRTLFVFLGFTAVSWGLYSLPIFARQAPVERVATHVIDGDPFKSGVLAALMLQVEAAEREEPCRPAVMRSAAIIRTRMAEQAIVDGDAIDTQFNALRDWIGRSLACSPADPFLWIVLYWVEINRNGFQAHYLNYLRLSYQLGPNEGWIALKRNGYALAIFRRLPPDLAETAIAEFAKLLDTGFYAETIAIFTGPGWREREILLPRLKDVAARHRQAFAKALYKLGYDVNVPGVALPDPRPWD